MRVMDIFQISDDRRYFRSHLWGELVGDNVRFGIDDFAQKLLGLVDGIRLPSLGAQLDAHSTLATIHSKHKICQGSLCTFSKSKETFQSPLPGKVVEVNDRLLDRPSLVQEDPYGRGWLVSVSPEVPLASGNEGLVPEEEIEAWIRAEIERRTNEVEAIRADWQ